jgi:hypothetical protein
MCRRCVGIATTVVRISGEQHDGTWQPQSP